MKKIKRKKQAFTLVEVIVSLAIISILIIPSMNMIVQSTKNIQKSKEREQAELLGKEVIEEIRAIDLSSLAAPSSPSDTQPEKTLSSGLIIYNKKADGASNYTNDLFQGEKTIDGLEVEVKLKRQSDITFEREEEKFDAEFDIYFYSSSVLKIKETNGAEGDVIIPKDIPEDVDKGIPTYKSTEPIKIVNDHGIITVSVSSKSYTINKASEVGDASTYKPGNIKFNFLDNNQDITIDFQIENRLTEDFNVLLSRRKDTKFNTKENITDTSKGAVIIAKEEFTENNIGDLYELTITVKKKGETKNMFEGTAYKNIILY